MGPRQLECGELRCARSFVERARGSGSRFARPGRCPASLAERTSSWNLLVPDPELGEEEGVRIDGLRDALRERGAEAVAGARARAQEHRLTHATGLEARHHLAGMERVDPRVVGPG